MPNCQMTQFVISLICYKVQTIGLRELYILILKMSVTPSKGQGMDMTFDDLIFMYSFHIKA